MSKYIGTDWEVLEIIAAGEHYHKIFTSLSNRDKWRMNSGVEYVEKELLYDTETYRSFEKVLTYRVFGYSGSEYLLKEGSYGIKSMDAKSVLFSILENSKSTEYKIRRLEENEAYEVLDKYLR